MFKLIDGTELTEEIKDAFKKKVTKAYIKLKDGTILSGENFLKSLEIEDLRYNEETNNFLGEAVAKRATVDLYNKDNAINVEDEEFEAFIGAELSDGTTAWISYGNFIVQKPENDDTKEDTVIEAFDYMCKFNKIYTPGVTFPCTYADIVEDICEQCGVELANRDFRNAEKVVKENFFINGEQCRTVLKQVAKIAFSWARVGNDNKLYIDFKNKDIEETFENFDLDSYIDLNKNNQLIPVDTIVLRNSAIESENVTIKFDKNAKINKFIGDMEQDTIEEVAGTTVENSSIHVTDVDLDFETEVLPMGAIEQDTIAEVAGTTVEGSSINATGVDLNYDTKVLPMGNISQETRSGYNLLVEELIQGSPWLSDSTNRIKIKEDVKLKANTTYTILTNLNTNLFNIAYVQATKQSPITSADSIKDSTWLTSNKMTFTTTVECYLSVAIRRASDAALTPADVSQYWFMLYEGTNDKMYEPHGEAPSLTYPSEVKGVGSEKDSFNKNICPTDFSKWESGDYRLETGEKIGAPKRIRLIDLLEVTPGEIYYFNTNHNDFSFVIRQFDANKVFVASTGGISNGKTLTVRADTKYLGVGIYRVAGEETASFTTYQDLVKNGLFKPFICLNSETDKTYVEHKEYCRYEAILGSKNIFIPTTKVGTSNIVSARATTTVTDDEYTLVATGTDMYFGEVKAKGKVYTPDVGTLYNVKGKSKIYLYLTNNIFNKNLITFYDSNTISLGYSGVLSSNGSCNIPTNAEYISIRFGYGSATAGETYRTKVMLSFEPITEYVKYQSQTLPIDIPIGQEWYSGKPYKVGSKWYRKVEWVKEYITSSTTATVSTTKDADKRRWGIKPTMQQKKNTSASNVVEIYSNVVKNGSPDMSYLCKDCITYDGNYIIIYLDECKAMTLAEFKTFCEENGVYIVYPLATPIVEEITDTHLIEQLENMQSAELYEGVTNLNTYATVDEVAEMPLSVKYNFITPSPSLDIPSAVKGVGSEKHINLARIEKEGYYRQYGTGNFAVNASYNSQIASVEPNKTYTIKKTTGDHSNIAFFGKDMTYISGIANATTITTPDNCYFVTVAVHKNTNDFMFYEGTADLPYTPYGYRKYETIVGNINLVDDIGTIKTGALGGLTVAIENGKIIVNGTPTSNYIVISPYKDITKLLEDGETYTLIRFGEKGIYNQCSITNTDGTTTHIHASSVKAAKFTFNKAKMKKVSYAIQSGAIASTGTLTNHECNFMLVKGDYINTNVNYMAHQEQSFLIDIPIGQVWYSGKPYRVGSKWYRKIEWEKEDVLQVNSLTASYTNTVRFKTYIPAKYVRGIHPYCNYLVGDNTLAGQDIENVGIHNAGYVQITLSKEIFGETVASANAKLQELKDSGAPLYVVYPLAEPYAEEITDTHLIAQLEAIKAAELYDGVTNVNSYKTSDDVAEMPLSVRYNFITPAPSTDRESPIKSVTGACNLYNVNGNLFDVNDINAVTTGAVLNPDDSITVAYDNTNGTGTKYINYFTNKTYRLKENTRYYGVVEILNVSGTGTIVPINDYSNHSQVLAWANYGNKTFTSLIGVQKYLIPFTTAKDFSLSTIKVMIRSYVSFAAGQSGSITFRLSVFEQEPDLEKFVYKKFNSQQFPLSLGSLELFGDNNGQDYIYNKNGKWYKHSEWEKRTFTGNEDWKVYSNEAHNLYYLDDNTLNGYTSDSKTSGIGYSNHLTWDYVLSETTTGTIRFQFKNGCRVYIRLDKGLDLATFKALLAEKNIYMVYKTFPVDEEITNTTLLSQLNAIKDEFFLVEGENHIMFNCDNGTQPQLEIKHYPNKYSLKETISTGNDLTLSASYEHRELVVKEDYFAYNEETRRDLIESARELFGLTYLPIDLSGIGTAYLENNDLVTVTDKMGNVRPTYCLNHILKYNGVLYDTIAAPAMTETETKYQNESQEDLSRRRTEVIVNKATQEIQLVSEKVDTYDSRISEVEVGLDGIISKIESDIDITRTINGLKTLTLEECLEGDLLELHIYGNNQVFKRITPSGTTYPSNELIVKDDSLIKITHKEIDEEGNYIGETSETIDLKIKEVLRQLGDVADSFDLVNNKATLTRRIGVNTDNSLYVLTNPIVEDLGDLKIPLVRGTNIIEIVNYSAMMGAKYVIINAFTNTFATTVDLKSAIEILYNQINLEVSKKVNDDEIIARINMAILGRDEVEIPNDINKSIIEILANKISIKSDNFELTQDGTVTAKEGNIAGLRMTRDANGNSYLSKNYIDANNNVFQSGLYIPNESSGTVPFLYAGCPTDGYLTHSNLYIRHDGLIRAKWFDVNGESGYFNINFDSGRQAVALNKESIIWKIDDEKNETFFELSNRGAVTVASMYASRDLIIDDPVHNNSLIILSKFSPETGATAGSSLGIYCNVGISGFREGTGEECKLYVQGYEILKTASDERIKDNIVDSEIEALKVINQIHHKSFDWNKEKAHKEGHIDIGYIAQELIEIDPNFVVHDKEYDTYQINTLYVLSTATKAIQELSAENNKLKETVDKQQKIIDYLIKKLDCENEILKILKEGE